MQISDIIGDVNVIRLSKRQKYMINDKSTELIHSNIALRQLIGKPSKRALKRPQLALSPEHKKFISKSSFFIVSSCSDEGECEISPRGDEPGFVKVIDDKTFIFIEQPGNRRLDTLSNLVSNKNIGLLFLVPREQYCLRIKGKAELSYQVLSDNKKSNTKIPKIFVTTKIEQVFFQCARAIKASKIWSF